VFLLPLLFYVSFHQVKQGVNDLSYENNVIFNRIAEKDFKENGEFRNFESRKGRELRKLVGVVKKIRAMMKEHKTGENDLAV
jgi:hypothetical protein